MNKTDLRPVAMQRRRCNLKKTQKFRLNEGKRDKTKWLECHYCQSNSESSTALSLLQVWRGNKCFILIVMIRDASFHAISRAIKLQHVPIPIAILSFRIQNYFAQFCRKRVHMIH